MVNYFLKLILKGKDFSRKIFFFLKYKKQKQYNNIRESNIELMPFPLRRELVVNKKRRFLRGDEYLFYMGKEFEDLEPGLTLLIKKISYICRDKIVLDVGANIGITSIIFSELFDEVIAFEPSKETFNVLLENLQTNNIKNVKALNYGLGDKEKESNIMIPLNEASSAAVTQEYKNIQNYDFDKVEIKVGDLELKKEINDKRIGLIKIDVEGLELEVLKGLKNTIKENTPIIILEMSCYKQNIFGRISIPDFIDSLEEYFPIIIAYDDNSLENINISSGKNNNRFKVIHEHIQNSKFPTIIGFQDEKSLKIYLDN